MANRELPDPGHFIEKVQSSSLEGSNQNFVFRGGQSFIKVGVQLVPEAPQNARGSEFVLTVGDSSMSFETKILGLRANGYKLNLTEPEGSQASPTALTLISQSETETVIQLAKDGIDILTTLALLAAFFEAEEDNLVYIRYTGPNQNDDFAVEPIPVDEYVFNDAGQDGTIGSAGDLLLVRGSGLHFALDDNTIHDAYWALLGEPNED